MAPTKKRKASELALSNGPVEKKGRKAIPTTAATTRSHRNLSRGDASIALPRTRSGGVKAVADGGNDAKLGARATRSIKTKARVKKSGNAKGDDYAEGGTSASRRGSIMSVRISPKKDNNIEDEEAEEEDEDEEDGRAFWLMKAEPESRIEKGKDVKFSIDDLRNAKEPEGWDGRYPSIQ